jgi:hypothetical protein
MSACEVRADIKVRRRHFDASRRSRRRRTMSEIEGINGGNADIAFRERLTRRKRRRFVIAHRVLVKLLGDLEKPFRVGQSSPGVIRLVEPDSNRRPHWLCALQGMHWAIIVRANASSPNSLDKVRSNITSHGSWAPCANGCRSSKFPYLVVSRISFSSAPVGLSTEGPGEAVRRGRAIVSLFGFQASRGDISPNCFSYQCFCVIHFYSTLCMNRPCIRQVSLI